MWIWIDVTNILHPRVKKRNRSTISEGEILVSENGVRIDPSSSSRPERFPSLLNFVTVICLLLCIAFQFSVGVYNYHKFLAIEKRLDQVERSVDKIIAEELPKAAANKARFIRKTKMSLT